MAAPDSRFFVIGVMRGGTTSLYHYLRYHPEICMTAPKEPPIWGRNEVVTLGRRYYDASYLSHWSGEKVAGETNPIHTTGDTKVRARRLAAIFPELIILILLRDPVERAFSHWWHSRCIGREDRPFTKAARIDSPYVEQGEYVRILKDYMSVFSRENIITVFSEDMFTEPSQVIEHLYGILGVNTTYRPTTLRAFNSSWNHPWVHTLVQYLSRLGFVNVLPETMRRAGRSLLSKLGNKPSMNTKDAQQLRRYYNWENADLEGLVGRQIPWRKPGM